MKRAVLFLLFTFTIVFSQTTQLIEYFEKSKHIMLLIDPKDGAIVKSNASASNFYGYSIEKLNSMKIQDINTFTVDQVKKEMELAKEEQRNYFIFNHKLANEKVVKVHVQSEPVFYKNKKVLFSIIRDFENFDAVKYFNDRLDKQVALQTKEIEEKQQYITKIFSSGFVLLMLIILYLIYVFIQRKKLTDSLMTANENLIKSDAQLKEANKRFSLLYNNSPDMYVSVSPDDALVKLCNDTLLRKTGFSREEIIEHPIFNLYHNECMEQVEEAFNEFVTTGTVKDKELILKKKDGGKIEVSLNVNAVKDDQGKILYSMSSWRDMTEHHRIEAELKRKDEMMISQSRQAAMGEMISMIAHQWRQPISAISMNINNIRADIDFDQLNTETLTENLDKIIMQINELSKTIDDFKDFFKPNKQIELLSPIDIFENSMNVIGKSLENNNIEVKRSFNCSKEINTYPRELMQVLINIIKNSKEILMERNIKEGIIEAIIEDYKDGISIKLCDNGGGVHEDNKEKIFDPYFTTKGTQSGTGLGLYISKTIIEQHLGGTIECFNQNGGACFMIYLPDTLKNK